MVSRPGKDPVPFVESEEETAPLDQLVRHHEMPT